MILENNYSLLDEQEKINPFLSGPAIAVEFGGGFMAGQLMKRSRNLKRSYPVLERRSISLRKGFDAQPRTWTSARSGAVSYEPGHSLEKRRRLAAEVRDKSILAKKQRKTARTLASAGQTLKRTSRFLAIGSLATIGFEVAGGIFNLGESFADSRSALQESMMAGYDDVAYYDSRRAMTQRQRAIQAIHSSQLSTRVAFGNEASYMHY